ncbi:MAG: MG2 domain-containing protein, partial [Duganella sp.]
MRFLSRLLAAAAFCGLPLAACADTSVTAFSPTGTVKGVRQVTARFSGQMVPLGDMALGDPFTVDCPPGIEGKGRWIDDSNWSYDFARDLPAGVACRFTVKPDARDLAGQPVNGSGTGSGARSFGFDTGGPGVVETVPYEGGQIDERQIFVLGLDAPASDATVAQHAWCRAEGVHEKIGVRVLAGAERDQVLAQRKSFVHRYLSAYFKARGVVWRADMAVRDRPVDRLPISVLQCQRPLPAKAEVALVWGAGMAAASGIATTRDQALAFRTRPDFTAKFSCERLSPKAGCLPFLPARVEFSAPVRRADALAVTLTGPGGKTFPPTLDKYQAKADYVERIAFAGPLPASAALRLALPPALKDDAGRSLLNAARFPLTVNTDAQPPLVKFPARFGIIEAQGDKLLPVTVRNVEAALAARVAAVDIAGASLRVNEGATEEQQDRQIVRWLGRLSYNGGWEPQELSGPQMYDSLMTGFEVKDGSADRVQRFTLPRPGGRQAFEVVGIPLRKPGFYVVELASPRLGAALSARRQTAYVSSAALVTNLVAHFKRGAASSLVWVTSLDQGRPVAGARVAVRDCAGKLLWQGSTDGDGVARIAQELAEPACAAREGLFISARHGADMTFTLSKWDRGIEAWRFNLPTEDNGADHVIANTVFDRTLLRAGETVHMKHFQRRKVMQGFALDPVNSLPATMFVIHEGSDQRYELALRWHANGTAANDWTIPADARQGWYRVLVGGREAGRFRVEQFRVPTMKAQLQGPKAPAVQAASVDLDVQVSYLSGGGAGDAPVQLRTMVQDRSVSFDDYADFTFSNGDVRVGVERSGGAFDMEDGGFDDGDDSAAGEGAGAGGGVTVRTRNLTLDKAGGARITIGELPAVTEPRELTAELSYQDANGETLSAATRVPLWPADVVIGIAPDGWVLSRDALKFQVVVLDLHGKPVADAPVDVDFFQRESTSHRRRLVGGFYAYESSNEIKALGSACSGRTDARGLLVCQVKAPAAGNLILRAQTRDSGRRVASAHRETWVADGEDWWFNVTDNDRIDLLPEKKRYEPGETASFQVRMPFREAIALVTVEREGVIDSYVRPLSGSAPVITVPIKPGYAPNVYVSALVVRGRVAGVQPTALVDLGKPAYKLGIAPVRVGWAANELKVQVDTDRQAYQVRDRAKVTVRVTRADGSAPPPGAEVALAAVDVGLLELM